jgi:hypothetical protein
VYLSDDPLVWCFKFHNIIWFMYWYCWMELYGCYYSVVLKSR